MKNKNVLVWLLVVLAVAGAVFIGYTYRGTFLQGKMGPVSGPGSGPVIPADAINRADFAKLLAVALRGDAVSSYKCKKGGLSDVKSSDSFAPYVCYLYDKDIVKGYPDGTFGAANQISRAEVAVILLNAYSASGGLLGGIAVFGIGDPYKDIEGKGSYWYYSSIYYGAGLGFFDVKPWVGAKFYPSNLLSKGRAKLWINNFKKALGK